ncbi:hypothetical protein C8D03_0424 [Bosea sp. 124]|nr:hypothetical protein C8D03_0424 [Bosea sp. 124]
MSWRAPESSYDAGFLSNFRRRRSAMRSLWRERSWPDAGDKLVSRVDVSIENRCGGQSKKYAFSAIECGSQILNSMGLKRMKILRSGVILPLFFLFFAASGASAQTIGYADAYDKIARACGSDVAKFCSNVALANNGVRSCLAKNQAKVSTTCKSTMSETLALLDKRAAAQSAALKVCDPDARRLCQGIVAHDGHRLQCLIKAERFTSSACNQVITNAGWR